LRTCNNKIGQKIVQVIYFSESDGGIGIGHRELQRKTGLRFAATNKGISKHRCLMNGAIWPVIELPSSYDESHNPEKDRKLIECCFDYLTLSEPPILRTFYNSELAEECLEIYDPVLREFIIMVDQLLCYLLNRMQLEWTQRKPTSAEVAWIDFFYPRETRNKAFSYLQEMRSQKDRSKNANHVYDSKIKDYDCLIKQTWNDIETKYSDICIKYHIYQEIYNLLTNKAYSQFLRKTK
jgi:hypothetical protein